MTKTKVTGLALALWTQCSCGNSGMVLNGSPSCRADTVPLSAGDVSDWRDFTATQVPPLDQIDQTDAKHPELGRIKAQAARNRFISGAYLNICKDRVLDNGQCGNKPSSPFWWACAAVYGSTTAGSFMDEGISAYSTTYRPGSHWMDSLIGKKGVLPAVKVLGDANGKIFDTVGWQNFAAAKCGSNYAARLVEKSELPERDRYAAFWRKAAREEANGLVGGSIAGTATEELLTLEQELIQPELEANKRLLGALAQQDAIISGVPGAKSFRRYATEFLGVKPASVNLADFRQRFRWERDHLLPRILNALTAPECAGQRKLNTLAQAIGEKQEKALRDYSGLASFARVSPLKNLPEIAAMDQPGGGHLSPR